MSQSLSAIHLHLVFSTKNRVPFFRDPELRRELHAYLGGISKRLDCMPHQVGGTEDHVHLLCAFSRMLTVAEWVKELKRVSNHWLTQGGTSIPEFAWQNGYGVFSVSESGLAKTMEYIARQEEHHRARTFQDEFRSFLKQHRIEWDERYLWD